MSNPYNSQPYEPFDHKAADSSAASDPYAVQPSSGDASQAQPSSKLPNYGTQDKGVLAGSGATYGGTGYQEPDFSQYSAYEGAAVLEPTKKSALALTAFILGLISLLTTFTGLSGIVGVFGLVIAIVALVRNRNKPREARRTWMSVTGLILSLIGIAVTLIIVVVVGAVINEPSVQACLVGEPADISNCLDDALANLQ